MEYMRIWTEVDIKGVEEKLIIVDDLTGHCPGCHEIGIKMENLTSCPKCGREFKYITSRSARGSSSQDMVKRIKKKLPNLIFVDIEDYERITAKKKGEELFKGI